MKPFLQHGTRYLDQVTCFETKYSPEYGRMRYGPATASLMQNTYIAGAVEKSFGPWCCLFCPTQRSLL